MAKKKVKKKSIETILETSEQMASLMSKFPHKVEKNLVAAGENLVGIFSDENYTAKRFANINTLKRDLMKNAIEDISSGVEVLKSSTLGIYYTGVNLKIFVTPHGSLPGGSVIFSINWKNVTAFKNWRKQSEDGVEQDSINAAIYFLIYEMSKLDE